MTQDKVREEATAGVPTGEAFLDLSIIIMSAFDDLQDAAFAGNEKAGWAVGMLKNVYEAKHAGKFGNFLCLICGHEITDDLPPVMCLVKALQGATIANAYGVCQDCVDGFEEEEDLKSGVIKSLAKEQKSSFRELQISSSSGRA